MEARRRLILHLVAAYDVPSSVLQWSYLPADARVADGVLPPAIASFLDVELCSPAEPVSVGVALARRLNLQRIASVDDHVDDEVGLATGLNGRLAAELEGTRAFAELRGSSYFEDAQRLLPDAAETGDLMALYLELNSPAHLNKDVAAQWHLFYRTRLKSNLDRARAALWEARNLNIASRIRQAAAVHSGGRVLVVIGAAHKPFLDQYLGQMMDVEVVQLSEVLQQGKRGHRTERRVARVATAHAPTAAWSCGLLTTGLQRQSGRPDEVLVQTPGCKELGTAKQGNAVHERRWGRSVR